MILFERYIVGTILFALGFLLAAMLSVAKRADEACDRLRLRAYMFTKIENSYIRCKEDTSETEAAIFTWINKGLDLAYQSIDEEEWLKFFGSEERQRCY